MTLLRAVLAEAIGSFLFLTIGYLAVVSATGLGQTVLPLLVVPFGFGFGLLAAITIFGHVSGGHFNPAVTLGFLVTRRMEPVLAVVYWIAQFGGAVVAAALLK
ncbi:MAG TPA: aquaporin, partial [Candidatus Limnocylindrales bacterium]|nr:aquaporin [Candidatus Limnocylindrales bacterium]